MEYIYAGILIHKLGQKIDEETVKKVITAAGGKADDGKVKALVVALQDVDIDKAIEEAALPVAVAAPAAGGEASEEKKKEKSEEDEKKSEAAAAAGLGALFG